jgi:hypothetical protein
MSKMNKVENVKEQYKGGKNLAKRTNLHVKHSTNKKGFLEILNLIKIG